MTSESPQGFLPGKVRENLWQPVKDPETAASILAKIVEDPPFKSPEDEKTMPILAENSMDKMGDDILYQLERLRIEVMGQLIRNEMTGEDFVQYWDNITDAMVLYRNAHRLTG